MRRRQSAGKAGIVALAMTLPAVPAMAQQDVAGQVRALAESPAVQRAFSAIEELEPQSLADLIELTEIPAPPFMERERAEVYLRWLLDAGADSAFLDEEGNVRALRRGRDRSRTIGFGGHLDTVFPDGTDVTVRQRGDTLFAPGVGDDTRGLIVVLTVLRAMEHAGIETEADIWFVGVVGEEGLGDLRGMKHIFRPGADWPDAWIDVDGGGIHRVVNAGLGSYRYRVRFKGPGGHSWGAFGLANPAHAQARAIHRFSLVADSLTRYGPRTSYNVGVIGGGTSINSIPFETVIEVDMRSEDRTSLDRIDAAFKEAMQQGLIEENAVRRRGPPLTVEIEQVGNRPSGVTPPSSPLLQRALASSRVVGGNPSLQISSTDSNIPISLGVPAVTIGRGGDGGGGHSPGEWWRNDRGDLAIKNALLLLVSEAGLARPRA